MQQIQRYFRKAGKAVGRFFSRVKKGSPIDIAILVCAILLVAVLAGILVISLRPNTRPAGTHSSSSSAASVSEPPASSSEPYDKDADVLDETEFSGTILPETADGGQSYVDGTMFIGDSNTYRLVAYELTTWQNNLSAVGMGIQHVTSTPCMYFKGSSKPVYMAKAVSMMQPKRIIITYGTNNTNSTTQTFAEQYRKALEAIEKEWPYADIIINAVPPVSQTYPGATSVQKTTDEFNRALATLAKEKGYTFLNSSEALKDPATGFARAEYMIDDGLHLNEKGAKAFIQYVRTHTHDAPDKRPALTTLPTHTATPEETFNPQASSSEASSSSSSSSAEGVVINFIVKGDKAGGSLSGTLQQTVKPGEKCKEVTVTVKDGYSFTWGCTEGRIEDVYAKKLSFVVPANTALKKIDVWVTFENAHQHTWSAWTDTGNGTCKRACTAGGCTNPPKTEESAHIRGNWTADPKDATKEYVYCTRCGALLETRTIEHTHTWGAWTDAGDGANHTRKCTAGGCTAVESAAHGSWGATDPATGMHICGVCGASVKDSAWVPPHQHQWGAWTPDSNGTTHTRVCTAPGCANPPAMENGNHDTAGEGGKCSVCGYAPAPPATTEAPPAA